jgi:hypothetical protein
MIIVLFISGLMSAYSSEIHQSKSADAVMLIIRTELYVDIVVLCPVCRLTCRNISIVCPWLKVASAKPSFGSGWFQ